MQSQIINWPSLLLCLSFSRDIHLIISLLFICICRFRALNEWEIDFPKNLCSDHNRASHRWTAPLPPKMQLSIRISSGSSLLLWPISTLLSICIRILFIIRSTFRRINIILHSGHWLHRNFEMLIMEPTAHSAGHYHIYPYFGESFTKHQFICVASFVTQINFDWGRSHGQDNLSVVGSARIRFTNRIKQINLHSYWFGRRICDRNEIREKKWRKEPVLPAI